MMSARPRDRILTTATELFHSEGIGAVGVNRIIGQADVAPMTLYRQFGNKDNLVAAALEQWSTSWLHRLADAMDRRGDDPSDRFDGLWDELQAWFAEEPFRGSFVANAATELRSEPHHPAQTRIAQHRQALRRLGEPCGGRQPPIRDRVAEGTGIGLVHWDPPARSAARPT